MATYYVRISGNDSSAGTSAGAAWRTLSKAFTTVAAGDQVYIGAGTYREALTISTAWASETKFTGDYTGQYTGDAGIVYWSAYTNGDRAAGGTRPLTTSGTPRYWTFENMVFIGGGGSTTVVSATVRGFTFSRCVFVASSGGSTGSVGITVGADITDGSLLDSCLFFNTGTTVTLTTSASADYDAGIVLKNCLSTGGNSAYITATGAGAFKGGGVNAINCTFLTAGSNVGFRTASANVSTIYPCNISNSVVVAIGGTGLSANTSGQIVDAGFNLIIASTARTNVTAATTSVTTAAMTMGGFEWLYGLPARPFGMPMLGSPFTYMGGTSVPSTDILGRTRTGNGAQWIDDGTATSGAANTITDSGKTFGINSLIGNMIIITSGTGSGQQKIIKSNTATAITVFENWATNPDSTSVYRIIKGPQAFTGKLTGGAATTATVSSAVWDTNQWAGYSIAITAGTASGQTNTITSNTGTVLTVPTWGVTPDNTSEFSIYRQTGISALLPSVGCFEAGYDAQQLANVVRTGTYSGQITGPGYDEFDIPVDTGSQTLTVYARYDARHGSTNKPQVKLCKGEQVGVSDETITMTAAVDTWEALTTSSFNPAAKGIVTIQLISRADYPDGNAFFDN